MAFGTHIGHQSLVEIRNLKIILGLYAVTHRLMSYI